MATATGQDRQAQQQQQAQQARESEAEERAAQDVAAQLDVFDPEGGAAGVFDAPWKSDEFKASPPARQRRF